MSDSVRLLLGTEHPCGYLPARTARSVFLDPAFALDGPRYQRLLELGFRRSGSHAYRPACAACEACRPVRVVVAGFEPDRSQRRCLQRNAGLSFERSAVLGDEHFALYGRYLRARHAGGGMDGDDRTAFDAFLHCGFGVMEAWDFRHHGRLLATAVVDRLPSALSAVYTFFEPEESARSLGTLAVLRQIEQARADGLEHVYLGYYVRESRKMAYKARFRPLQSLTADGWRACPP